MFGLMPESMVEDPNESSILSGGKNYSTDFCFGQAGAIPFFILSGEAFPDMQKRCMNIAIKLAHVTWEKGLLNTNNLALGTAGNGFCL
jgi:hypothetical protein